jgi:hypothetical protein
MSRLFAGFVFFVVFFRLSVVGSGFYLAIPLGCLGMLLFLRVSARRAFVHAPGYLLDYFFILLGFFFLVTDIFEQKGWGGITNFFSTRWLSIIILSVLPALLLNELYFKGSFKRFVELFSLVLWAQLFMWLIMYFSPDAKRVIYEFMGQGGSVNLLEHNLNSRGFGVSNEINFTGPFVMVMLCFFYMSSRKIISLLTIFTQLINSNMVVVSLALSYFFSDLRVVKKVIFMLISVLVVVLLGERIFDRLYAELASGGLRTVKALIDDHVFFINAGWFEHLFGTGVYVFQGGYERRSDIGWVIMYNYGGLFFCACFITFLFLAAFCAFGGGARAICWFIAGLILNTKGMVFGPNSYFFVTALVAFIKYDHFITENRALDYVKE